MVEESRSELKGYFIGFSTWLVTKMERGRGEATNDLAPGHAASIHINEIREVHVPGLPIALHVCFPSVATSLCS